MFPSRDDLVAHLDRHAREEGIELRLGTEVERIDRRRDGWRLVTSAGDVDARQVVVANGNAHTPRVPQWPGADGFSGRILHSSAYTACRFLTRDCSRWSSVSIKCPRLSTSR